MENKRNLTDYELAQLCEVAYIAGVLKANKEISFDGDIDELLEKIYLPILNEWKTGVGTDTFETEEEEGYIGAYAERRLVDIHKLGILQDFKN